VAKEIASQTESIVKKQSKIAKKKVRATAVKAGKEIGKGLGKMAKAIKQYAEETAKKV